MITRVYSKLKSKGMRGVLKAVYHRVLPQQSTTPQRLSYFSRIEALFASGIGLELGGPSAIFGEQGCIPVYPVAPKIDNCNFGEQTVWEGAIIEGETFVFDKDKPPGRQYIAEATELGRIPDSCYDFVLSSHCLEHLANPLNGLAEWIRVLKKGGLLVLVVPHKDGTFDHRRPVTALEHLIEDYDRQTDEDDTTHLDEILRLHDLNKDLAAGDFEAFKERSKRNLENRCLHQHVFDTRLAVEVVNYIGLQILAVELFQPFHIIIVAEKRGEAEKVSNGPFRGIDSVPCWRSPFPSDQRLQLGMAALL